MASTACGSHFTPCGNWAATYRVTAEVGKRMPTGGGGGAADETLAGSAPAPPAAPPDARDIVLWLSVDLLM